FLKYRLIFTGHRLEPPSVALRRLFGTSICCVPMKLLMRGADGLGCNSAGTLRGVVAVRVRSFGGWFVCTSGLSARGSVAHNWRHGVATLRHSRGVRSLSTKEAVGEGV